MGQFWMIANLDKEQTMGSWFGLRWLFNDHKLDDDALHAIASNWSVCPFKVPEPESLPFTNKSSGMKRVLRNLTKNQYVREEAIKVAALESTECKCDRAEPVGFGEVVLSRICWSAEYYGPHRTYSGNHHKGPWAGNRFDISTVEMVEFKGSQWVDVSDEVSAEMNRIWRSEYGQQWVEWKEIGQVIAVAKNQEELMIGVLDTHPE
ncbi:hypothetical protein PILCRDRAFT_86545 [Piloderma croceum F 1598]|uniref:Uncharacterized protein n=1 Tax=Piloderma croceum (strain F 1598) TaxID=765440 RepID=A0A0C3C9F9_PILCF|nr:hypothetical protein PILCRDRAFT_86545 [Piloderma croceum F 1598]